MLAAGCKNAQLILLIQGGQSGQHALNQLITILVSSGRDAVVEFMIKKIKMDFVKQPIDGIAERLDTHHQHARHTH